MADQPQGGISDSLYKYLYPIFSKIGTGASLPAPHTRKLFGEDTKWTSIDDAMEFYRNEGYEITPEFQKAAIEQNRRDFYAGETSHFIATGDDEKLAEAGAGRPMDLGETLTRGAMAGITGNRLNLEGMGGAYVPDDFASKAVQSAGHVGGMIGGPVKGMAAAGTALGMGRLAAPAAFTAYGAASKADSWGERLINTLSNAALAGGLTVLPRALVAMTGKVGGKKAAERLVKGLRNPAGRGAYDIGVFSGLGVGEKVVAGEDVNFVEDVLPGALGGALGVGAVAPAGHPKSWLRDVEPYKLDIGLEETRRVRPSDWAARAPEYIPGGHEIPLKEFFREVVRSTNEPIKGHPATEVTSRYLKGDGKFDDFTLDVLKNRDMLTGNITDEQVGRATHEVVSKRHLDKVMREVAEGKKTQAEADSEIMDIDARLSEGRAGLKWDDGIVKMAEEGRVAINQRARALAAPPEVLKAVERGDVQEMRRADPNFPDPTRYFQGIAARQQFNPVAKHLNWEPREWEMAGIKAEKEIKAEARGILEKHGIKTPAQREDVSRLLLDESGALSDQVSPEVLNTVTDMRSLLDRIFTANNQINEALGQPIIDYRAEYLLKTRAKPKRWDIIGRVRESAREKPSDQAVGKNKKIPSRYTSPRERPQGLENYPREWDIGKLMDIVAADTGKKISHSPIVKSNRFIADLIEDAGYTMSAEGIRNVTGYKYQNIPMGISGWISEMTRPYRAGRAIDEGAGWFKKKFNQSKYLGNMLFSLVTQPASMILAGAKYPNAAARGVFDVFRPTLREAYGIGYAGIRKGQTGMRQEGTMDAPGSGSIVPKGRAARIKDVALRKVLEEIEYNTGVAATGIALREAYRRGMPAREAGIFAAEFVGKTQSFYDPLNRAAILSSRPLNAAIPAQGYLVEVRNWVVEELGSLAKAEIGVDEGKTSRQRIATVAMMVGMWHAWRSARKELTGYGPSFMGQIPFMGPLTGEQDTYLPQGVKEDALESFRLMSEGRVADGIVHLAAPYTDGGLGLERGWKAVQAAKGGDIENWEMALAIPFGEGATPSGWKKRKKMDKDEHLIELTRRFGGGTEVETNYMLFVQEVLKILGYVEDDDGAITGRPIEGTPIE